MADHVTGIHHITAVATNPRKNFDFYTRILGLRLVKKTVNFDDPETYHLYYGDRVGSPGTLLTFFLWEGAARGKRGVSQVDSFSFCVRENSFDFWSNRFDKNRIRFSGIKEIFGEKRFAFSDPDGLVIEMTGATGSSGHKKWMCSEIDQRHLISGLHHATVNVNKMTSTAAILTDVFGFKLMGKERNRYRFVSSKSEDAAIIDLLEKPGDVRGNIAGGSVHHIAFRVQNDSELMEYRNILAERGFHITDKIDRTYFQSVYFREPGGTLFELTTDNPGFTVDEPAESLGETLKLPPHLEGFRAQIESNSPELSDE